MKKALAVIISMLMIFSIVGVMASAEETEGLVKVEFYNDGELLKEINVLPGTILNEYAPAYPEKADTETTRYTFKGWQCNVDGELYFANSTLPVPNADQTVIIFTAEYSEENIGERQTFWQFIQSIFERINLIFEYFAKIFEW